MSESQSPTVLCAPFFSEASRFNTWNTCASNSCETDARLTRRRCYAVTGKSLASHADAVDAQRSVRPRST